MTVSSRCLTSPFKSTGTAHIHISISNTAKDRKARSLLQTTLAHTRTCPYDAKHSSTEAMWYWWDISQYHHCTAVHDVSLARRVSSSHDLWKFSVVRDYLPDWQHLRIKLFMSPLRRVFFQWFNWIMMFIYNLCDFARLFLSYNCFYMWIHHLLGIYDYTNVHYIVSFNFPNLL